MAPGVTRVGATGDIRTAPDDVTQRIDVSPTDAACAARNTQTGHVPVHIPPDRGMEVCAFAIGANGALASDILSTLLS